MLKLNRIKSNKILFKLTKCVCTQYVIYNLTHLELRLKSFLQRFINELLNNYCNIDDNFNTCITFHNIEVFICE